MQVSIDSAKRNFDIDLVSEIDRITKDMDISNNGYPLFWKHIKDKKSNINDKKFDICKINKDLVCPMNYLMELKFKKFRNKQSTLPMSYFFNKFEIEEDRRKCKKVEDLIEKYSLDLLNVIVEEDFNDNYLLLRSDFDNLINDIRTIYISKTYIGLMSWLIDRAFLINTKIKSNKNIIDSNINKNKSLLLKVLYDINSNNILKIFSKNK